MTRHLEIMCATLAVLAVGTQAAAGALRLADGQPLVGVYFFPHWWEPWKSSDARVAQDLARLKSLGFNTVFLDHEWSQMIDGDWKWLDRSHKLAREAGIQILPWLSAKVWGDIGSEHRRELIRKMYGVDIEMGTGADGKPNRTKPYDPAVIEAGVRYCAAYIDRYADDGSLLRVMRDGKPRPVVALSVELEWKGSCDPVTQQMFRLWLRARYGEIADLNKAWGTSFSSFERIDLCDPATFDLAKHADGKSAHPAAVEDHIEFRSQVIDTALAEIKRRLKTKYPDLLIAAELPYQLGCAHPHAVGYRIGGGANPSSSYHADILLLRATDTLTPEEEKALLEHKKRASQQIILTYRTYADWGRKILDGKRSEAEMVEAYADQAARLAEGFGFYSWNEMVDTHVVPDPDPPHNPASHISAAESEAAIKALGAMAKRFADLKNTQR